MLNVIVLNVTFCYCYAECRYAECCNAEYRYAECRCAECRGATILIDEIRLKQRVTKWSHICNISFSLKLVNRPNKLECLTLASVSSQD
jgi:hypothetical protein